MSEDPENGTHTVEQTDNKPEGKTFEDLTDRQQAAIYQVMTHVSAKESQVGTILNEEEARKMLTEILFANQEAENLRDMRGNQNPLEAESANQTYADRKSDLLATKGKYDQSDPRVQDLLRGIDEALSSPALYTDLEEKRKDPNESDRKTEIRGYLSEAQRFINNPLSL